MQLGFILSIIFAIIVTIFAVQNAQVVDIKLFTFHGQASLALVILISVAVGAAILALFNVYSRLKINKEIRELKKKISLLEKEQAIKADTTIQSSSPVLNQGLPYNDKNQETTANVVPVNTDDKSDELK
ncbi:MAG: LapA family protein [Eubacteriaceae bacterium]|nr:LapA family protein [Eubacteriaceae bacterium]